MIYVSSDLHGYDPALFQQQLEKASFGEDDFLFILGDVIDRGEWGAELLLWLTQQPNVQLILGNHEAMLLSCSFLFEEVTEKALGSLGGHSMTMLHNWVSNGATPTINGLRRLLREDPESVYGILDYLRDAPLFEQLEVGGQRFTLVHSGLGNYHPGRALEDYTPEELLWERPTLRTRYDPAEKVIFGHTPTLFFGEEYRGKAVFTDSWICIDPCTPLGNPPILLRLDDLKVVS